MAWNAWQSFGMRATFILLAGMLFFADHGIAQSSPTIDGCPIFPPDNIWNTPVDTLPLDLHSDVYIAAIGNDIGLHPDFGSGLWDGGPIGIPYNVVPGTQAKVPIGTFWYWAMCVEVPAANHEWVTLQLAMSGDTCATKARSTPANVAIS